MNKANHQDDMRSEYKREDLGVGVRGQYYAAYLDRREVVTIWVEAELSRAPLGERISES